MDVSFFQLTSLTCPQCRTACEARIWLVVDATERADLLERVCNETLHDLTCPNCNQTIGQIDAPLLIFQPGKMPPLLFSPAQQTSPEQDREQVVRLVSTLRRRLNKAWNDEWLAEGLTMVPRSSLPSAVHNDNQEMAHSGDDTNPDIPSEFYDDMLQAIEAKDRYESSSDPAGLETSIKAWERILNQPSF